jgi:hypothetical protein
MNGLYPDISGGSVGPNGESEGPRSFALGGCFGSLVRSSVGDGFTSSVGGGMQRGGGILNGKIQTIKKRSFHNLEITSLSLSGNKITTIEEEAFVNLSQPKTLDRNQVKELNPRSSVGWTTSEFSET